MLENSTGYDVLDTENEIILERVQEGSRNWYPTSLNQRLLYRPTRKRRLALLQQQQQVVVNFDEAAFTRCYARDLV